MSLSGSFAVNPSGAATYSIPIALPPGTSGMIPSLSLEYSSQGPNGIMGVGWSLAGLPSIGRCSRTLVQDNVAGGINFDANDRFCLDGQRLTAISGAYGADGTQYRTEIETFSKVTSRGVAGAGPAWFEVRTKSGQILEFGNSSDSRILAQGKTTARSWTVNKVSDTKGNYYTVSYVNDTTNGQSYPSRIDYTGNASASVSPFNSVQFVYAARPDIAPLYESGSLMQNTVRLTNVKTFAGAALITDYALSYQVSPSSGRSQLISVTSCGPGNVCLPATTFQWSTAGAAVSMSFQGYALPNGWDFGTPPRNFRAPIAGDFNGDGIGDVIMASNDAYYSMLGNGEGTFRAVFAGPYPNGVNFGSVPSTYGDPFVGDFNGDGKADLLILGDSGYQIYLGNGDGTLGGPGGFAYGGGTQFGGPPRSAYRPFTGDFNGDGKTDFAVINSANCWTFLSNGDGTFSKIVGAHPNGWNFGGVAGLTRSVGWLSPIADTQYNTVPGDYDGDGKTDFAMLSNTNAYVLLSNGDGTFRGVGGAGYPLGSNYGGAPGYQYALFPGDFNGDGKADFAVVGSNAVWGFLGKGDGTFTETVDTLSNGWNFGLPLHQNFMPFPADVNGDGRTDLALLSDGGYYFLVSNGDGHFSPKAGTAYGGGFSFGGPPAQYWEPFPGDYNGDGLTDITFVRDHSYLSLLASGGVRDAITSVTSGLGAVVTISYDPLTKSSVYTKGSGAAYPVQEFQGPVYVVSRVDTSNGLGGNYSSTYTYAGAKVETRGRGFLGFAQTTVKDLQTSISDTTNYSQSFPYIGLVASTSRTIGASTLGQSVNTYQFSNAAGAASVSAPSVNSAPYKVSLTQNVSSGADLDGSTLPTVTTATQYDAYLNATQVVVSTPDGFSKTSTNTYTNDATNWFLGRLTASTVTSQAPEQLTPYCTLPWGATISSGQSVTAYSVAGVSPPQVCSSVAETRTCGASGNLSGSYTKQSCSIVVPVRIYLTSGSNWTVPTNWNSSNNKIEVIAGGGGGAAVRDGGGGGAGGGAYSSISNLSLTPGSQVTYNVGIGGTGGNAGSGTNGGNTWFNGSALNTSSVSAQGGAGGYFNTLSPNGLGGIASNGIGTTKYSGGNGGLGLYGGGGGGGAAGPQGNGGSGSGYGGSSPFAGGGGGGANGGTAGGNGGTLFGGAGGTGGFSGGTGGISNASTCGGGSNGGGGAGGYTGTCGGGAGSMDAVFDATHGSGGGGGGGGAGNVGSTIAGRPGGPGANFGGGGGGGGTLNSNGGNGGSGIIVITYTPSI